ncbi:MAG: hypothetical protein NTZ05_07360 [Chloroflexi bacterium]|nr:hypothetical protein [Chloroflexota bacterium]
MNHSRLLPALMLGLLPATLAVACAVAPPPAAVLPQGELQVTPLSTDLAVGTNRLILALKDREGRPVNGGPLHLRLLPLNSDAGGIEAVAAPRPSGSLDVALYGADARFERPGAWRVEVQAPSGRADAPWTGNALIEVHPVPAAPALGAPAPDPGVTLPPTVPGGVITVPLPPGSPVAAEVSAWSGGESITVVTIAAPAWCPGGECAAQVAALRTAAAAFPNGVRFLHLDPFPGEALPSETPALLRSWNLRTQPWTFVLDRSAHIAAKFEGYIGPDELTEAVRSALALPQ